MIEKKCWIIHSSHVNSCNETAILKYFYSYGDDILAHVEKISNKVLSYIKSNLITLVDKTITNKIKVKKTVLWHWLQFYRKEKQVGKGGNYCYQFFSDENTWSSKSDIDEVTNIHIDEKDESKISRKRLYIDDIKH